MAELDEVVIIDVSVYQGVMDWAKAKLKIHAAYMRATMGTSGIDAQYYKNRSECYRLNIPWGVYHVFFPDLDPVLQAEHFVAQIGVMGSDGVFRFYGQLRPAVDMERHPNGYTKAQMGEAFDQFCQRYFYLTNNAPLDVYTRGNWWDTFMPRTSWGKKCKLWVAHYNAFVKEPQIPLDWQGYGWFMWQWSADGNGRGAEFGAQSKSIDINRVKGGLAQLRIDYPAITWKPLGGAPEPEPEPAPEPTPDMIQAALLRTQANLRVRDAIISSVKYGAVPGKIYKPSNTYFILPKGSQVEALEEIQDGKNIWVRVGQRQFVAKIYDDMVYLK